MFIETVFQKWGEAIREAWQNADWNVFWGWILIVVGILSVFLIILFTEFKRKERDSVKFTAIMAVVASIFLGFGLHMVLIGRGAW